MTDRRQVLARVLAIGAILLITPSCDRASASGEDLATLKAAATATEHASNGQARATAPDAVQLIEYQWPDYYRSTNTSGDVRVLAIGDTFYASSGSSGKYFPAQTRAGVASNAIEVMVAPLLRAETATADGDRFEFTFEGGHGTALVSDARIASFDMTFDGTPGASSLSFHYEPVERASAPAPNEIRKNPPECANDGSIPSGETLCVSPS